MFHSDSMADDAYRHIQCMNSSNGAGLKAQ